ncbi:META domain-containing protein [Bradyrhizobium cenepequi]|uniref:META domain-containing protein n=1 Tax=Bradyrhizobium cenepequi TaxID=2821403 RepID=UPI001CE32C77|nr:META domain-containing protein [Bradyrhizobium cenepequi]MCA6111042.1 META domain-containing protein [Bradyrhizobium cenepequi]
MVSRICRRGAFVFALLATAVVAGPACADEEFPFGFEMTLDAARMPGSKRIPSLDIGDNGEVVLELWCKGGKGQFSVAGNTIIFVPGAMEMRNCPPERAQADDDLLAALSDVATWRRQGDAITLIGSKALRFRLNTN